jgi:hypothetical protein
VNGSLDHAVRLAAAGMSVFPCAATKAPTCPKGFKAATSSQDCVVELWGRHPGPLVDVRTGADGGLDVLDIDAKHESGRRWWIDNRSRLPSTRVHRTRSGGLHLLFQHVPGIRCSAGRIVFGVDVRGDDGYVIWWPAYGLPVLSNNPLAPWPAWLLATLRPPAARPALPARVPDDRSIGGLVRAVVEARPGQRNSRLFWAACRLGDRVRSNLMCEDVALAILQEAGQRAGLPLAEVRRTATSGLRAARAC